MPIAGLNKVLENLLESVSKSHNIKTWNIFQEVNGEITFRLKFSPNTEHSIDDIPADQPMQTSSTVSFKRKSDKQLHRDKERAHKRQLSQQSKSNSLERLDGLDIKGLKSTLGKKNLLRH